VRELGEPLPDWVAHWLGGAALAGRAEPELEGQGVAEVRAPKLTGVRLPQIGGPAMPSLPRELRQITLTPRAVGCLGADRG